MGHGGVFLGGLCVCVLQHSAECMERHGHHALSKALHKHEHMLSPARGMCRPPVVVACAAPSRGMIRPQAWLPPGLGDIAAWQLGLYQWTRDGGFVVPAVPVGQAGESL